MYRVIDTNIIHPIEYLEIARGEELDRSDMDPKGLYIIDEAAGKCVWVWVGDDCSKQEKKECIEYGKVHYYYYYYYYYYY